VKVKLVTIREQKSRKSLRGVIVLDSFDKVTFSPHQLVFPWWFLFYSLVIPWLLFVIPSLLLSLADFSSEPCRWQLLLFSDFAHPGWMKHVFVHCFQDE